MVVVVRCGPIGLMVALAALASGAGQVLVADLSADKLAIAARIRVPSHSMYEMDR